MIPDPRHPSGMETNYTGFYTLVPATIKSSPINEHSVGTVETHPRNMLGPILGIKACTNRMCPVSARKAPCYNGGFRLRLRSTHQEIHPLEKETSADPVNGESFLIGIPQCVSVSRAPLLIRNVFNAPCSLVHSERG